MGFFERGIGAQFPDAKVIHRALFGVFYEEDIYDKFCGLMPWVMRCFHWRIDQAVRRRRLIFVHVPRAAGTSIAQALYGPRNTRHHSIRYFRTVAPRFFAQAESFAILRDPFDRFASSYAFVRSGGTETCRMSDVFVRQTAHLKSVDDYLSFIEERDDLSLDFVMRPQSWFVCDLETGAPLVRRLFLYGQDDALLADYLKDQGVAELPWLNMSERMPLPLSARQKRRIEKIYARDFALVEALRRRRAREGWTAERIARIAAE
jgi:sulfotransferase famil protein